MRGSSCGPGSQGRGQWGRGHLNSRTVLLGLRRTPIPLYFPYPTTSFALSLEGVEPLRWPENGITFSPWTQLAQAFALSWAISLASLHFPPSMTAGPSEILVPPDAPFKWVGTSFLWAPSSHLPAQVEGGPAGGGQGLPA